MLALVQIVLAAIVAAGYFTVAAAVVPRMHLDEDNPRFARAVRLGATVFFVGCGLTHTHIMVHAAQDSSAASVHEVLFHLGQVAGVWVFVLAALRVVDVRIERRKTAADRLREEIESLSRANADLEDFAHAVSHDLQEPLATISGFADLLSTGHADELGDEGSLKVEYIQSSAERMRTMLAGVLAYSRAAGNGMVRREVDLGEVVEQTTRELAERLGTSGTTVVAQSMPMVFADELQLGRVLQNLIANAVKFRRLDRPAVVRISAREQEDGTICISVADNGVGIPEGKREMVFGMFSRLDEERDGSGIGLAVCQKIVDRHGGRIWVEGNEDGGSTFRFTLPQRPARDRASASTPPAATPAPA